MKKQNVVDQVVKKVAYTTAERTSSLMCVFFFHQPKLPECVKKLRKF